MIFLSSSGRCKANSWRTAAPRTDIARVMRKTRTQSRQGIIPAPEAAHAIRVAIDEALKCKATGQKKVIAFNLSGHGHFDMMAYEAYHHGQLEDYEYPQAKVDEAMTHLPKVPAMA